MTWWLVENWVVEGVMFIAVGFLLAQILCVLARLMDRDK
jgi:hypothetical protein